MSVLYHLPTLPPKLPKAEAITQEITALKDHFGGEEIYVNPNQQSPLYVPRLLFGFQKLKELGRREDNFQLHHFYNPDPFPFFYLRFLKRPVVYSISCGLNDKRPNIGFLASMGAVAASDKRSYERLKSWGLENVFLVKPGIDTSRFTHSPLPLNNEIRLMVGSAPWTQGQFQSKGVDALLEAALQSPHLHLVFLWRGVLVDEMEQRVRQMGLGNQVTLIHQFVDVNSVLATVHASVALVTNSAILKSYPHSLLDSLAAGKPVLISRTIPMADYVEETGCGVVAENVTPADIIGAVEALKENYGQLQGAAKQIGQRDFSHQKMIASFETVYNYALSKK